MKSTSSRFKLASQQARTYAGSPRIFSFSSTKLAPNFVANWTFSLIPLMACKPLNYSLLPMGSVNDPAEADAVRDAAD